jgi:uncharacterized phosphosugar-binding protein
VEYVDAVTDGIARVRANASAGIALAGTWAADTIEVDGIIRVFGSGHAGILADEAFYRAGGLAAVSPIRVPGLLTTVRPITDTTEHEREDGYVGASLATQRLDPGDLVIVHSVSGRNAAPVEVGRWARDRGVRTVAITSLAAAKASQPRNALGLRLDEVVDLAIDDGTPIGDAALRLDGLETAVGPVSTILGAVVLHSIMVEGCRVLIERGIEPPVFTSSNVDGGDARNRALLARYAGRVDYL